jgi:hypothetical protein
LKVYETNICSQHVGRSQLDKFLLTAKVILLEMIDFIIGKWRQINYLPCVLCNIPEAQAGLPDGLFSNQKFPVKVKFGWPWNWKCRYILDQLEYFGIVCGHLVYFLRFGRFAPRKIWQHWAQAQKQSLSQSALVPGLPDGIFSDQKNPDLDKFWRALEWKMLVYFMKIWNVCGHLVNSNAIW